MRARNIKPAFFKNDELAELSFEARLLFIGLWLMADREGYLEYRPKRIKAEILPYDSSNVEKLLEQLGAARFIQFFYETLPNGNTEKRFIFIPNFTKHQHPHKNEKASEIANILKNPEITGQVSEMHHSDPAESVIGKRKEERGKRNTALGEITRAADRVIDYLNEKSGKRFRHSNASRKPIIARMKEGFTEDECRKVIDTKVADKDFDKKYLRPETLFRPSKFEAYLNEDAGGEKTGIIPEGMTFEEYERINPFIGAK